MDQLLDISLTQPSPGEQIRQGSSGTPWDHLGRVGISNKGLRDEGVTAWDALARKMLHLPRLGSRVRFASPAPIFSQEYNSLDRGARAPPTPFLLRGSDRGSGMGEEVVLFRPGRCRTQDIRSRADRHRAFSQLLHLVASPKVITLSQMRCQSAEMRIGISEQANRECQSNELHFLRHDKPRGSPLLRRLWRSATLDVRVLRLSERRR